jgi:hypothetical protein
MKLIAKNSKFKQGIYMPTNKEKYKGRDYPRYLSSWELKLFRFCDKESTVLEWSSESIVIPYVNPIDGKVHNYITDAVIKLKTKEGPKKFLVEVKPYKQTIRPIQKRHKITGKILKSCVYEQLTYLKNEAKWEAAKKWCKKHDMEFTILTEHHLNIRKYL